MGNALLYISLLSVALIASFTGSAILNDLFAICNSRSFPTNQIMNCEAGHLAVEVPGEGTSNEWCEPVPEETYKELW